MTEVKGVHSPATVVVESLLCHLETVGGVCSLRQCQGCRSGTKMASPLARPLDMGGISSAWGRGVVKRSLYSYRGDVISDRM